MSGQPERLTLARRWHAKGEEDLVAAPPEAACLSVDRGMGRRNPRWYGPSRDSVGVQRTHAVVAGSESARSDAARGGRGAVARLVGVGDGSRASVAGSPGNAARREPALDGCRRDGPRRHRAFEPPGPRPHGRGPARRTPSGIEPSWLKAPVGGDQGPGATVGPTVGPGVTVGPAVGPGVTVGPGGTVGGVVGAGSEHARVKLNTSPTTKTPNGPHESST